MLQIEMASKKKSVGQINIQAIQEVATDIGALIKCTSNIRGKTAKIQNLTKKYKLEIDDDLEDIKSAVDRYQKKLMAAVGELETEGAEKLLTTQEVELVSRL